MIVLTYDIGSTNIKLLILKITKNKTDENIELIFFIITLKLII